MTENSTALPTGCLLRPADSRDKWAIFKLVLGAKLDPTQLRLSQFWVIQCENKIIACGQLRSFPDAQELGSLVVASNWRSRGLGSLLVRHLIQQTTQPLYLECATWLVPFYQRLDFVQIPWNVLPKSLKIKFGLTQIISRLLPFRVSIMQYQCISL